MERPWLGTIAWLCTPDRQIAIQIVLTIDNILRQLYEVKRVETRINLIAARNIFRIDKVYQVVAYRHPAVALCQDIQAGMVEVYTVVGAGQAEPEVSAVRGKLYTPVFVQGLAH